MVRSSNRRAPPAGPPAAAPGEGPAGEAFGEAPGGGALALDLVTAALVGGAEEAELALALDAMPAWTDGETDTAADSIVCGYVLRLASIERGGFR